MCGGRYTLALGSQLSYTPRLYIIQLFVHVYPLYLFCENPRCRFAEAVPLSMSRDLLNAFKRSPI